MKYYYRQNIARYEEMKRLGRQAWAETIYGGSDYADFSSRAFLDDVVPRLWLEPTTPTALELGCGVGPGALYLSQRGFRVHGVDLIADAITEARRIAVDRDLDIRYDVMDVTRIPHEGPVYDLVVDSYCLQSIVLDEDREAVFTAVRARLDDSGYYLISSAMYATHRHDEGHKVIDQASGRVFDRYDEDGLYEAATDLHYEPYTRRNDVDDRPDSYEDAIDVNGQIHVPLRRYRDGARLRAEVESHGFEVLYQSGEYQENLVAVHEGSGLRLRDSEN